jgi:ribonuclease HII
LANFFQAGRIEAGCDEAGRGCLAGPVVAAAVILAPKTRIQGLNDSKQLSEKKRNELAEIIMEEAIAWAVAMCTPQEIDEINILKASFLAMQRAVDQLTVQPEHLLIDGNRFSPYPIPHTCVVKGDAKFASIAAASILAKTTRDAMMQQLHETFPQYFWNKNKGYPAPVHRAAIAQHGPCVHHRKSFKLLEEQLRLF